MARCNFIPAGPNGELVSLANAARSRGLKPKLVQKRWNRGVRDLDRLLASIECTRYTELLEFEGESKTLSEWCRFFGVPESTPYTRYKQGIRDMELLMRSGPLDHYQTPTLNVVSDGQEYTAEDWREYCKSQDLRRHDQETGPIKHPFDQVHSECIGINTRVTYKDQTKRVKEWAGIVGVQPATLVHRLKKYPVALALAVTGPKPGIRLDGDRRKHRTGPVAHSEEITA